MRLHRCFYHAAVLLLCLQLLTLEGRSQSATITMSDVQLTTASSNPTSEIPFSISDRGGTSVRSVATPGAPVTVGYGSIQPAGGSTTPSGLAIFGYRQNGVLISEATSPASSLIRSGRIFAEVSAARRTGLALANPNNEPATVSFFFTDANGDFGTGNTSIPPNGQLAAFLDEAPFNGGASIAGTLTFNSSIPIAALAVHGLINERSEYVFTTLSVTDLEMSPGMDPIVLPHFVEGGGWATEIVLTNPTSSLLTGTVEFRNQSGDVAALSVDGHVDTKFAYAIPPRSSQKLRTDSVEGEVLAGSVRVIPTLLMPTPSSLAIFYSRKAQTTISEVGVSGVPSGTAFRLYVETLGEFGTMRSMQTGIAVANMSGEAATVTLELYNMDGSFTGLKGSLTLRGNGQTALFLHEVPGFGELVTAFQGVLRVSSTAPVSMTGLRARYNERNEFLMTATPPVNEAIQPSTRALFFPQIANSGGYSMQFILFNGQPGSSSGTLQLFSQNGTPLSVPVDSWMAPPFLPLPPGSARLAVSAFTVLGGYRDGGLFWYVPHIRLRETSGQSGVVVTQFAFRPEGIGARGYPPAWTWNVNKRIDPGASREMFVDYADMPEFEFGGVDAPSISVVISYVDDLGQKVTLTAFTDVSR